MVQFSVRHLREQDHFVFLGTTVHLINRNLQVGGLTTSHLSAPFRPQSGEVWEIKSYMILYKGLAHQFLISVVINVQIVGAAVAASFLGWHDFGRIGIVSLAVILSVAGGAGIDDLHNDRGALWSAIAAPKGPRVLDSEAGHFVTLNFGFGACGSRVMVDWCPRCLIAVLYARQRYTL